MTANLLRNTNYTFNFSKGSSYFNWGYWRVYADWNHDGDFTDSGEQEISMRSQSNNVLTLTISVPANAALGNTRMRVMMKKNSYPSPCETYAAGETEDYTLHVAASYNGGPVGSSF